MSRITKKMQEQSLHDKLDDAVTQAQRLVRESYLKEGVEWIERHTSEFTEGRHHSIAMLSALTGVTVDKILEGVEAKAGQRYAREQVEKTGRGFPPANDAAKGDCYEQASNWRPLIDHRGCDSCILDGYPECLDVGGARRGDR